jgi:hypothetical protein
MNQITLTITFVDGTTLEVNTAASDIVKWETYFDLGIDKLEKITHLLYLAWLAITRLKKTGEDFTNWIDNVSSVEVADPKASNL